MIYHVNKHVSQIAVNSLSCEHACKSAAVSGLPSEHACKPGCCERLVM